MNDALIERAAHVMIITMNRPQRRNALSGRLVNELIVAFELARDDADVGAIVLQGAGGAFCSGGDLSQMAGGSTDADRGDVPDAMRHPDGMQIKVSRQELSRLVGCSREMAGRVLKVLEEQGLVSASGKTIVVYNARPERTVSATAAAS